MFSWWLSNILAGQKPLYSFMIDSRKCYYYIVEGVLPFHLLVILSSYHFSHFTPSFSDIEFPSFLALYSLVIIIMMKLDSNLIFHEISVWR